LLGLVRTDFEELCRAHGLGEAKAAKLKATLELARRISAAQPTEMSALDQEQLRVLLLDTKNRLMRMVTVYQGSVNSAQVRVAEVFRGL
jgi:DNA repair protein RadC